jgi:hypothetical protein
LSLGKSVDEAQKYQLALKEFVRIIGIGSDARRKTPFFNYVFNYLSALIYS